MEIIGDRSSAPDARKAVVRSQVCHVWQMEPWTRSSLITTASRSTRIGAPKMPTCVWEPWLYRRMAPERQ